MTMERGRRSHRSRSSRSTVLLIIFAVLALAMAAYFLASRALAAYVDGRFITRAELRTRIRHSQFVYDLQLTGSPGDQGFVASHSRAILDQMIAEQILLAEQEERGIAVSPAEEEAYVAEVLIWLTTTHFAGSTGDLESALRNYHLDLAELKVYLAESLLLYRLRGQLAEGISFSEDELRTYYEANRERFDLPEMIRIRHVVVASRAEADILRGELAAGKDFALLASQRSLDLSTRQLGGDLNWRVRGEFIAQFDDAAWALEQVGQLSQVVESQLGFHIIKLEGKRGSQKRSFAEVRESVRQILFEEREATLWEDFLRNVRKKKRVIVFGRKPV